jgi:glycosyltransferase involved in cell wall biosynthesis
MRSLNNIVILTPGFAADENDSTAIPSLQFFALHLKSQYPGMNLDILSIHYPYKTGHYSWNGLKIYSAGGGGKKITRCLAWIRIFNQLFRLHKSKHIDIIHAFWLNEAAMIGLIFSRLYRIKFLATAMGQDVKKENSYLRFLRSFTFDVVTVSLLQKDYLHSNLRKATVVNILPLGIETSFFKIPQGVRQIDILGIGGFNENKNYLEFIEIIAAIVSHFPGIRCRMLGDGLQRDLIEKKIRLYGLGENIILAGTVNYKNAIEEMHHGKILLHTSNFEGQPCVFTEALAAGLHIVSHPVGIAATLQSKKLSTGITQEELITHLLRILREPDLDHSPEILCTIDETCDEYHIIYTNLLNN